MKELSEEQKALLRKPLPKEAVSQHPTKKYLSSIKGIYVTERLNEVFGLGKWKLKSKIIDDSTGMVVVQSELLISEYGIELESFGGNDNGGEGSKNFDKGDAYKGAVTDALTKICSYLEIGIDVFKGIQKGEQQPENKSESKPDDNRPWLTEQLLKKIIERFELEPLKKQETKDQAFKTYRMKKEYREQIEKA